LTASTKISQLGSTSFILESYVKLFSQIIFPPMFDKEESLKECEGDIFLVGEIINREITF
jgi:hypothetical protein